MDIRRVVTGNNESGKSVVVSDDRVDAVTVQLLPGTEFHRIWGADDTVKLPSTGEQPQARGWYPAAGGFRFALFTLGPEDATPSPEIDMDTGLAELRQKLPGLVEPMEPDQPGMHTTDTIDFNLVLSGEVWLELDDGAEVLIRAGEAVVQNGTRHAWHNRSATPCVMAVALVGATR